MAGACEQHEAQYAVHQKVVDIEALYFLEYISDTGIIEDGDADQQNDTENGRKQHESDLVGHLGDLFVKEPKQTDQSDDRDKNIHSFHVFLFLLFYTSFQ